MVRDDAHFRELTERFGKAALGGSWLHALEGLAQATGASRAQMIGVGSRAAVPFNWITDLDDAALMEWLDLDGPDPRLNARVRRGLTAPEMELATDAEFATEADLRSPVYDLYRRYEIDQSCQTTLIRQPDFV